MRINLNHTSDTTAKNESTTFLMIRFAVTYSVFLLIILLLMVYLHRVSTTRSEQDFWDQDQSTFESAVSLLDNNFTTMDSITRQLSMNTKLYRLATMTSTDDNDFYLSGLAMKQSLASYMYSYNELPFSTYFVYLRNSGYIISVNTFNSEQLYYIRNYLSSGANFNEWHDLLNNNLTKDAAIYPLSDFMLPESDNAYLYVLNMDVLTYKDIPATVAFHISEQTFRKIFNGVSLGDTGYILAVDDQNQPVFSLCGDEFQSSEDNLSTLAESVLSLSYDGNNTCIHDDTHIMRMASKTNDWTFYLVQPESIYPSDYQIIFLFILFAAVVGGLIMIFILVRNNMRPILHLDGQLKETLHANTQLIEEAATVNDVICHAHASLYKLGDFIAEYRQRTYHPIVQQAKEYIHQHAHEPIRTGQLAQALGISREYLSRTFKAVEGISLCAFIRDNRIKTAKKLLRHSERSILDISRYLGFSSQSHFTESFKAETGTTPQEYRRIFRET